MQNVPVVKIVFKARNVRGFAFSAGFSTTVADVASRRRGPREVPTFFRGLEDSRAPFEATLTPLLHFARRGIENKHQETLCNHGHTSRLQALPAQFAQR
jgi:hypothetical protein